MPPAGFEPAVLAVWHLTILVGVRLAIGLDHLVYRVSRCGAACFGARRCHVALRGGHGFVAEQLHQRVDADVGAGEFGGVGMA